MVSPRTRAQRLQEWRDAQERQGLAADEIAEKRAKMERFVQELREQRAVLKDLETKVATFTQELSYLEAEERRLSEPRPIGSERQGGSLHEEKERERWTLMNRTTELLNSRQAALEAQETTQTAIDEAQGELYILSGSNILPEEELAESQKTQLRIQDELAPPPAQGARSTRNRDDTNGGFSNAGNNEGTGE